MAAGRLAILENYVGETIPGAHQWHRSDDCGKRHNFCPCGQQVTEIDVDPASP